MTKTLSIEMKLAAAALLTASAICEFAAARIGAQTKSREASVAPDVRALVRQAVASTGLILVRNSSDSSSQPRPRGSAVIIRSDGVVATNLHVITNVRTSQIYDEILFNLSGDGDPGTGSRHRLRPLLTNKQYDLALLRVESDAAGNPVSKSLTFPTIEIADSRRVRLLDDLFIIGFPEKGGSTVTINRGVVEGVDILAKWIKTDARVIHGNSGGAAVNSEGRLVGIPTKVVADQQPVDKDGDGFPDDYRNYGAVGFLRPAHLVAEMLGRLGHPGAVQQPFSSEPPNVANSSTLVTVRGVVKSAASAKPLAGALVGLLPLGETSVTESTLLTWGSTNSDGAFKMNKPVPPGRYTLKAKALANQTYTREIEIGPNAPALIIEMRPSPEQ